ncbi:IS6 family transposase [Azospirillum sp.]|uniref:IS6 family transposase n=1 Tax=Azospirillum sp. TaxID=34012 RepID=UPI002D567C1D|nr:IS6 family transposase [Azospirillum sp.]HYF90143.1 IS6 family transposase [Azospirillum sp.]
MRCPHCSSTATTERSDRTAQGYRRFRCRGCGRQFNERTGSLLNRLQVPTDVAFLIVLWRLRMKLSLRDFAEVLLLRGLAFSHEAVRDWEAKLAQLLTEALRKRRKGKIGRSWYVDETYLQIAGQWHYLYRAIDTDGNLVDVYLSAPRNQAAAEAFFHSAVDVIGIIPETITTDKYAGYPPALEEVFGDDVKHRTSKFKNNHLEQDHRGIKGRTRPMRGFQTQTSAHRFCRAHDEVRDFLRPATKRKQHVPAARRRAIHVQRVAALRDMLAVA